MAIPVLGALWLLAAALLWRTSVPADLRLPDLDPREYFSAAELRRSERYEGFLRADWIAAIVTQLVALGLLALQAPRLLRRLPLRGIAAGVALGALALALVWAARLPFGLASHWWRRRYGISSQGYVSWLLDPWLELAGGVVLACAAIALAMLLARRLGRKWWLAGGPAFAVLGAAYVLAQPLLLTPRLNPLGDPRLSAEIRALAIQQGVGTVTVEVREASRRTTVANAEVVGIGPTRRVILWDTLLDGRFSPEGIRVISAHELGHVAANHVWKSLGWLALLAFPAVFVLAEATQRRGGLAEARNVPLAILVFVGLQLALLPATNLISRRYEAEADWLALSATRDPAAARGLFRRLAATSLGQPDPPAWAYVLLEDHPTTMRRIAMAEIFASRRKSLEKTAE